MKIITALVACLAVTFVADTASAESYKFKVSNKTDQKITGLLVSEDGTKWSPFDLGDGIPAGSTATMVWDESTNGQDCEQEVKAVYADKSESESESFDFCEAGLELDFS